VLAAVAVSAALGCSAARETVRATGALFSSPRPVTKAKSPVAADARLAVVWVGHSTVLIQLEDKVILTDPVFTSTVGSLRKRLVEPGIDPKDLPRIDAALVSQLGADHLSLGSLEMIAPKVRALLLPAGGAAYITDGFSFPSYELRTWQVWEKDGVRVTAVPVDRGGGRYAIDQAWLPREASTAYVIEYKGVTVYFSGATAYNQRVFVETGQRFPNIDLAILPIAPIEPRDEMHRRNLDPAQAIQAFVDLGAARMVPIHYDTFVTSTDQPGDALRELAKAEKSVDLGRTRIVVPLAVGERRVFVKAGESQELTVPVEQRLPPLAPPSSEAPPAPQQEQKIPDDDSFE
jgi:L-ascorbate metabolism protein UlaG (beta-lactamase superfamily)